MALSKINRLQPAHGIERGGRGAGQVCGRRDRSLGQVQPCAGEAAWYEAVQELGQGWHVAQAQPAGHVEANYAPRAPTADNQLKSWAPLGRDQLVNARSVWS